MRLPLRAKKSVKVTKPFLSLPRTAWKLSLQSTRRSTKNATSLPISTALKFVLKNLKRNRELHRSRTSHCCLHAVLKVHRVTKRRVLFTYCLKNCRNSFFHLTKNCHTKLRLNDIYWITVTKCSVADSFEARCITTTRELFHFFTYFAGNISFNCCKF